MWCDLCVTTQIRALAHLNQYHTQSSKQAVRTLGALSSLALILAATEWEQEQGNVLRRLFFLTLQFVRGQNAERSYVNASFACHAGYPSPRISVRSGISNLREDGCCLVPWSQRFFLTFSPLEMIEPRISSGENIKKNLWDQGSCLST